MRRRNFIAGILATPLGIVASKLGTRIPRNSPQPSFNEAAREMLNGHIDDLNLQLHRPIISGLTAAETAQMMQLASNQELVKILSETGHKVDTKAIEALINEVIA